MNLNRQSISNNSEPHNNTDRLKSSLIFQCKNCLNIIGDSYCWFGANSHLKCIILKAQHPNTEIDTQVSTSSEGHDLGCTYVLMKCKPCQNVIGKVYKATSRRLDYLRDRFTYNVNSFKTYQLGSYSSEESIEESEELLELGDTKALVESIAKIKQIVCAFHDRIRKLEGDISNGHNPDTSMSDHIPQNEDLNQSVIVLEDNSSDSSESLISPSSSKSIRQNEEDREEYEEDVEISDSENNPQPKSDSSSKSVNEKRVSNRLGKKKRASNRLTNKKIKYSR